MVKLLAICFVFFTVSVSTAGAIDLLDWQDTTNTRLASVEDSIIPLPSCYGDFTLCFADINFRLYPNPVSDQLNIDYGVPVAGQVDLYLYNLETKKIINLVNKQQTKGRYFLEIDLTDYVQGCYLCILQTPGYQRADKIIIIR